MDQEERDLLLLKVAADATDAAKSAQLAAANSGAAVEQGREHGKRISSVETRLGRVDERLDGFAAELGTLKDEVRAGVHQSLPDIGEDVALPLDPSNDTTEPAEMNGATDVGTANAVAALDGKPMRKPAASITTEVKRAVERSPSIRAMATETAKQTPMLDEIMTGVKRSPLTIGAATSGGVVLGTFLIALFNTMLQSCAAGHMSISGRQYTSAPAPILPSPTFSLSPAPSPAWTVDEPLTTPPPTVPAKK